MDALDKQDAATPPLEESIKVCSGCNLPKKLDEFHRKHNASYGRNNICKACARVVAAEYRIKNPDKVRRRQNAWYRKNKQHVLDKVKKWKAAKKERRGEWRQTPEQHKENRRKSAAEWRGRNREKIKAHDAVNNSIRAGRIKKQPCEVCGNPKSEGHHDDYSKPLDVRWLCRIHHKEHHKRIQKTGAR